MDVELEPACVVQQAHCPGMKCSPSEDFPTQIGLSDKIPPVKPCFKKKQQVQKRLDTETLRALRPIFTSLLGAGNLDGVFVHRGQSGGHSNLCEPVVKKALGLSAPCPQPGSNVAVLMPGASDVQGQIPETHPPPGHPEQEIQSGVQGFPSETNPGTAADSTNESFQHHPFHSVSSDAAACPVCPDKILEGYTSGLFQENSCLMQYNLNPNDEFNAGLFQDKSEEASLDLVFELLNQLQYHTHQEDEIEICVDFLQGNCIYGSDCPKHHTVLPYHWQIRRTATQTWQSVTNDSQEHLERLYCNPDNDRIKVKYR